MKFDPKSVYADITVNVPQARSHSNQSSIISRAQNEKSLLLRSQQSSVNTRPRQTASSGFNSLIEIQSQSIFKDASSRYGSTNSINPKQVHFHSRSMKQNSEILLRDLRQNTNKPLWIISTRPKPITNLDKSKPLGSIEHPDKLSSSSNNWKGGIVSEHLRRAKV
jgi:hypothetical protein